MQFSEQIKMNLFDITPLTFIFDFDDEYCEANIAYFFKLYEKFAPNHIKCQINQKIISDIKRKLRNCVMSTIQ